MRPLAPSSGRIATWVFLLVVGASGGPGLGADGPPADSKALGAGIPVLPAEVASAMQEGRFEEASGRLDVLIRESTDADVRGYLGLIRGIALRLDGRLVEAREALGASLAGGPNDGGGRWGAKLRSELAGVLVATGRSKEAEALARVEVESLLLGDRKDRLAEGFRGLAARALATDDPLGRPDPAAAHALLAQARSVARGEALRARLLFEAGACSIRANQSGPAIEEFRAYVEESPDGVDRDAARFFLGEARRMAGQVVEARVGWSDLARDGRAALDFRSRALYQVAQTYGQTPEAPRPPEPTPKSTSRSPFGRGFESVAPGLSTWSMESRAIRPPATDSDLGLQVSALRRLMALAPGHPLAVRAGFELGSSYQSRGRLEEALGAFRAFLRGEGFRLEGEESRRLVADLTPRALLAIGDALDAQGRFDQAIATWSDFLARYPSVGESAEAGSKIHRAQLKRAEALSTEGKYAEARAAWVEFASRNPLDPKVAEVLERVAESLQAEGKVDEAIAAFEGLIARFPATGPGRHARLRLGMLFEEAKGDPGRAIEQYRELGNGGEWAVDARRRIERLDRPNLQVVTPRAFRSGEGAHLKITTRNLGKLSFAAYKLDPEAYFRKKRALEGVEALDVGLVAPDAEWSESVERFARYKPIEATYELKALQGPGVWAVKVTDDSRLTATTMVLRNDLDAMVRSSTGQSVVFVQDRKTGLGRPGARVLLLDAKGTLLEGRSGADGVALLDWPRPLDPSSKLNYLILDGSEAAGSSLGLSDRVAMGLTPRVYLHTDRPAYRPGQRVEIRGVVRDVKEGVYAFEVGEVGQLNVFDPEGRRVGSKEVKLSEFGTFHDSIGLVEGGSTGSYSFRLERTGKPPASGSFRVEAYLLEDAELRVDLPRSVVFRGETARGEVVARSRYGASLAGRPVEVRLPDGRTLRGATDPSGKFPFEVATEGLAEEQDIAIEASLPVDNVSARSSLMVAVQGFRIDLSTAREVYLPGETFPLRALTVDPLGQPTGQALSISILKRVGRGALAPVEREVGTARLETDPATGKGSVSIRVDDEDGGSFLLRASSTDRFGNAISEDRAILVSGRGDSTRLRFLTDRTSIKVGEVARVDLHNREGSGLALLTWEADRLIRYRIQKIGPGSNPVEWGVEGPEFPNVTMAAASMLGTQLEEARVDLKVDRELRVTLKALRPSVGPGEEVVVEVSTADQLGRPVAAEVSMAMVDRALLRIYAESSPPIGPFFHDRTRLGAFASGATNGFRYQPESRAVDQGRRRPEVVDQVIVTRPDRGGGFGGNSAFIDPPTRSERSKRLSVAAEDLRKGADDPASLAILAKLDARLSMNFPEETPLQEIKDYICRATEDPAAGLPNGIPIYVDPIGLQDADKTMQSTVAIHLEGIPLKTTLRLLLKQIGLTYFVDNGLLRITSPSTESDDTEDPPTVGGMMGGMGGMGGMMGGMGGSGMGGMGGRFKTAPGEVAKGGAIDAAPNVVEAPPRPMEAPKVEAKAAPAAPEVASRRRFVETAYWNPSVVTGADGKARVTFLAPMALSEYVIMARGVTGQETLAGQETADLAVRKPLFVDLRTPPSLVPGDRPRFSARVHHEGVRGRVEVTLSLTVGTRPRVDTRRLDLSNDGVDEVGFDPFDVPEGDSLRLALSARLGDRVDEVRAEVPIRPWGIVESASASGSSSVDATAIVGLPPGRAHEGVDLVIAIAPTLERLVVDAALGRGEAGPARGWRPSEPPGSTFDRASDLLAIAGALEYLGAIGSTDEPDRVRLTDRARGLVSGLVAMQNADGGWAWFSTPRGASTSHGLASARVVWALSKAEAVGLLPESEAADRSIGFLSKTLNQADGSDHETRASLLHALSTRFKASFEPANALLRLRDDLSDTALAYLSLALARLDRPGLAGEALGVLATRAKAEPGGGIDRRWWSGNGGASGESSAIEATGLAILAFAEIRPDAPELAGAVEWLLAHRAGPAWRPSRANGPCVAALSRFYSRGKAERDRYRLVVQVNGAEVDRFEVIGQPGRRTIVVPRASLKADGPNRVSFDIEGRGTFGYSATLTGFTRGFDRAGIAEGPKPPVVLERAYLAASPEFEGKTLPNGFTSVLTTERFANPASRVRVGGRVRVSIRPVGSFPTPRAGSKGASYLLVEDTLPAGASMVEGSLSTDAAVQHLADGVLTVSFAPGQVPTEVSYELNGLIPGRYRTLPPRVFDADDPGRSALGSPGELTVLGAGEDSTDAYRPTPDELLARGRALFDSGRVAGSLGPLDALATGYKVRDDLAPGVRRMLLFGHLATGQSRKIVEDYEAIREKDPGLVIPFDKLLAIGKAYADIGEHERAYLGWLALAEASYLEDARFAEALRQRGQPLESVAFLLELWRIYPVEATIESDFFALSRVLASLATRPDPEAPPSPNLGATRADLIAQAARLVRSFLARNPRNPLADEASLALVGDEIERQDYPEVVALAGRFARAYPSSPLRDRFGYDEALGRFHLGQHDRAVALADALAARPIQADPEAESNPPAGRVPPRPDRRGPGSPARGPGSLPGRRRRLHRRRRGRAGAHPTGHEAARDVHRSPVVGEVTGVRRPAGRRVDVQERRGGRDQGFPPRPDAVLPLAEGPGRRLLDRPGRHPSAGPADDQARRRAGLRGQDEGPGLPLEGRRGVPRDRPGRQPLRLGDRPGHDPGHRRLRAAPGRPAPGDGPGRDHRGSPARGPGQRDRIQQRRPRRGPDRPPGRLPRPGAERPIRRGRPPRGRPIRTLPGRDRPRRPLERRLRPGWRSRPRPLPRRRPPRAESEGPASTDRTLRAAPGRHGRRDGGGCPRAGSADRPDPGRVHPGGPSVSGGQRPPGPLIWRPTVGIRAGTGRVGQRLDDRRGRVRWRTPSSGSTWGRPTRRRLILMGTNLG